MESKGPRVFFVGLDVVATLRRASLPRLVVAKLYGCYFMQVHKPVVPCGAPYHMVMAAWCYQRKQSM